MGKPFAIGEGLTIIPSRLLAVVAERPFFSFFVHDFVQTQRRPAAPSPAGLAPSVASTDEFCALAGYFDFARRSGLVYRLVRCAIDRAKAV